MLQLHICCIYLTQYKTYFLNSGRQKKLSETKMTFLRKLGESHLSLKLQQGLLVAIMVGVVLILYKYTTLLWYIKYCLLLGYIVFYNGPDFFQVRSLRKFSDDVRSLRKFSDEMLEYFLHTFYDTFFTTKDGPLVALIGVAILYEFLCIKYLLSLRFGFWYVDKLKKSNIKNILHHLQRVSVILAPKKLEEPNRINLGKGIQIGFQ